MIFVGVQPFTNSWIMISYQNIICMIFVGGGGTWGHQEFVGSTYAPSPPPPPPPPHPSYAPDLSGPVFLL